MMKRKQLLLLSITLTCINLFAAPVIHKVAVKENLEFLEAGRKERMDLYYPADPLPGEKFPGIVIIHGGGWTGGIRNADREVNIASNLVRMGYVCISIDYRLANSGNLKKYGKAFPVNIQDCKKAVQWLRKNADSLHIDVSKIGCIGGSAGGHLATVLALSGPESVLEPEAPYPGIDTSIQACVNLYGIMDFTGSKLPVCLPALAKMVMGKSLQESPEEWQSMSPVKLISPGDPPVLQLHGTADKTVDYHHATVMKEALDEKNIYNELILLENFGHAFSLQSCKGKPLPPFVRQRVLAFYDRFLKDLTPEEAAERFAALEDFEKKNPAVSHYGMLSLNNGKVTFSDAAGVTISGNSGEKLFEMAYNAALDKALPAKIKDLKTGIPVAVVGEVNENGAVECRQIFIAKRFANLISGQYGILRKDADKWYLSIPGKKDSPELIIPESAELFICTPVKAEKLKPGTKVVILQARDYGDLRKITYALFTE